MKRLIRAAEALLRTLIDRARWQRGIADEGLWKEIEAGLGSISDFGHVWDSGPLDWAQRRFG